MQLAHLLLFLIDHSVSVWHLYPVDLVYHLFTVSKNIKFDFEGGASMEIGSINKSVRSNRHRSLPLTGNDLISIKLDASTGKQIASVDLRETLSVCCQGCLIKTHYWLLWC